MDAHTGDARGPHRPVLGPRRSALWLAVSLVLVISCSDWLWIEYGGPAAKRWCPGFSTHVCADTVRPPGGQIGPFILLGITGFLIAERAGRLARGRVRRPDGDQAAPRLPLLGRPRGLGRAAAARRLESDCRRTVGRDRCDRDSCLQSPRPGSILGRDDEPDAGAVEVADPRVIRCAVFGEDRFGLQFVPTVIGLGWLVIHAWRHGSREWNWSEQMPLVLLISFATASYGVAV